MATITVLYPNPVAFKMDYYLASHMPMVHDMMKPHGMTGYRVNQVVGLPDGNEAPYNIVCELYLGSLDGFKKGFAENKEKILGDIPNFSDKGAILLLSNVTGSAGTVQ
ncbi:MAG: hypothetical protein M1820_005700 [Bogoriella megaspora]|nr:MAG: hypothetical protein M1820_005700 [Bogoriella megaspora]